MKNHIGAAAVLASILMALPSVAVADWQNTRWGMTEAQVLAAVKRSERVAPETVQKKRVEGRGVPALRAPYAAGDFTFSADFYFGGPLSGLSLIKMDLLDLKKCSDLIGSLRLRYGSPAQTSSSSVVQFWTWRTDRDQVGVVWIGSSVEAVSCTLSYQPRTNDRTKGL